MDLRGAGLERGVLVTDRRQHLVLDVDQLGGALRDLGRERGDGGDHVALVTDHVTGEQRAVLDERAVADVGHVVLGDHGENAVQRARL